MRQRAAITFVAGAWFGLATGLLQGLAFLAFQEWRWLNWSAQIIPVDANILWAAPAVNVIAFWVAGLFLFLLCVRGFAGSPGKRSASVGLPHWARTHCSR